MIQLIYLSDRPKTTSDEMIVDSIVLPAMRFNERADITGCLWFGRRHFLQVLEGPEEAVRSLYGRIEKDERHCNVRLLVLGEITERSFSRFTLKCIRDHEMEEIERVIAQFGGCQSANDGNPLVNHTRPGSAMADPFQTILVAVRRLASWRARPRV